MPGKSSKHRCGAAETGKWGLNFRGPLRHRDDSAKTRDLRMNFFEIVEFREVFSGHEKKKEKRRRGRPPAQLAQLARAEVQLARAGVQLARAGAQLARRGAQLARRRAQLARRRAQLARARAQLARAKAQLGRTMTQKGGH